MKLKHWLILGFAILSLAIASLFVYKKGNPTARYNVGDKVDSLNGVYVFYNGGVDHIGGRNVAEDGYNLGLKYQCVEFVKRYYYEHYDHKMPDSYGHAKDFFDPSLQDGELNKRRDLLQFVNKSGSKPKAGDLLIFDGTISNSYGHVAIISKVSDEEIEIIQQNPGPFSSSRVNYDLDEEDGKWEIENIRVLGWLRKP